MPINYEMSSKDIDDVLAKSRFPAQGLEHGCTVAGHMLHVVTVQEVPHDGAAGTEGDIFTQDCAFPANKGREAVLDGRKSYNDTGGEQCEIAQVVAELPQRRNSLK